MKNENMEIPRKVIFAWLIVVLTWLVLYFLGT